MTPEQFAEWAAYFAVEPWGFPADDMRLGQLAHTVAVAAGSKGMKPEDFMLGPRLNPEDEHQEIGEQDLDQLFDIESAGASGPPPKRG